MYGRLVPYLNTQLSTPDYWLLALGGGFAYTLFRHAFRHLWDRVKAFFSVSVEVTSRDSSYEWLYEWLNLQPYSKNARRLTLQTTYYKEMKNYNSSIVYVEIQADEGDNKPLVMFIPGMGSHFLRYKGSWVLISRAQSEQITDPAALGGCLETLTITTFGRDRSLIEGIIDDAMNISLQKEKGKTTIYTNSGGNWVKFTNKVSRPLSSVVLKKGLKKYLLGDIQNFMKDRDWYQKTGIPYRRGYLLYGPPGTGKTSFVLALAGFLGVSICQVSLSNPEIDDTQLTSLLNSTPQSHCIVLIEDIDFIKTSQKSTKVTLSGLLNALDGVSSQEGRLVFLTTNHLDVLDPALIRPGRVDIKVLFDLASKRQAECLFINFFPGERDLAKRFGELIPDGQLSMAQLQGYLQFYRSSPMVLIGLLEKKNKQNDWRVDPTLPEERDF